MWKPWLSTLFSLLLVVNFCSWLSGLEAIDITIAPIQPVVQSQKTESIGIGGLIAFNSTIGRAAKAALELAVRDVNNALLLGQFTQLVLHLGNTNCSAFQGAAAGKVVVPLI